MKKILFSMFLISICGIFISSAFGIQSKQEDYSIIINLAGKQRMLIQKMVKETLLIYSGIDTEKNRSNLKYTVNLFLKTLKGLRNGDSSLQLPATQSELIKTQIDTVMLMFKEIEFIFERIIDGGTPSRDAVIELAEREPLLLNNMDLVVQMYEDQARNIMSGEVSFLGGEINLAGKQRMLSQKMAKEALLIYLDIESRKNKRLLQQTYALFEKTLKGLKYGDGELGLPGTRELKIVHQIDRVMSIWSELKPIIERSSDIMIDKISKEELEKLGQLNVLVLDEVDKTVRMYEDLAR